MSKKKDDISVGKVTGIPSGRVAKIIIQSLDEKIPLEETLSEVHFFCRVLKVARVENVVENKEETSLKPMVHHSVIRLKEVKCPTLKVTFRELELDILKIHTESRGGSSEKVYDVATGHATKVEVGKKSDQTIAQARYSVGKTLV